MDITLNEVVFISVLSCFLIAGFIWFCLQKPVRETVTDKEWKLCECCRRENTHQRLENLNSGVLHPFCLTCSSRRKFKIDEYKLHPVQSEPSLDWLNERSLPLSYLEK